MIFEITLSLPPTLNDQINFARQGWQVSARHKKHWTNIICQFACTCDVKFKDKVWLEFHWYLKTFARDHDNVAAASKYIMDGLVEAAVIKNDNLCTIQSPVIHYYHRSKKDEVILRMSKTPDFMLEHFSKLNMLYTNK
ncbi:hypothetical protein [Iningainema tapete]|uniref:Uncharacterized protein n=1 Tax=Iningainema tapete BLCC-T55 TaxID=2748662 RepID=A0A8J6XR89_9CYAN|nr:hypothetical protein [Iningainema tapete]MBD2772123.1 hypothetical protein [Iningainema tapete BLCC-T55]